MGKGIYNPVLSSSRFISTYTYTYIHIPQETIRTHLPILGIFLRTYRGYGIRILSKTRGNKTKQIRIEVATAKKQHPGKKKGELQTKKCR